MKTSTSNLEFLRNLDTLTSNRLPTILPKSYWEAEAKELPKLHEKLNQIDKLVKRIV